jgi:hypothetical protein
VNAGWRRLCGVTLAGGVLAGCPGFWGVGDVTEEDAAAVSSTSCRLPTTEDGFVSCPAGYLLVSDVDAGAVTCCPAEGDDAALEDGAGASR